MNKVDIRNLLLEDLELYFAQINAPKFRARQVYEWIWKKSVRDFDAMSNLPKKLRDQLKEDFELQMITEDTAQFSADGTIKTRYKLHDDNFIESVLIPVEEKGRFTVCISSQEGCSLSCKFCATGQMKRMRNLSAAEIYDQVVLMNQKCKEVYGLPITNIVYMGMGEPLLTYKAVKRSIEMITSEDGLHMSAKRITLSTAGIAKMIKKLADDNPRVNLALSLHAADDIKRNSIMEINESNDLNALTEALIYFYQNTKDSKITFEYIAFQDFNDSMDDARNLLALCRKVPAVKVNIIEYNPVAGIDFVKSEADKLEQFTEFLLKNKVNVSLRRSRGKDIDAACGQLANK